jgi:hypothetical protein
MTRTPLVLIIGALREVSQLEAGRPEQTSRPQVIQSYKDASHQRPEVCDPVRFGGHGDHRQVWRWLLLIFN